MKQILLSKEHDITSFASTDQSRYVINGVHYHAEKKLVEATDGRMLLRVPVVESEEFPPTKGDGQKEPVDCIIPTTPFRKAMANIPKSSTLPVLSHAKLDANGKVTLTTTDLDTEQAVTSKPIDGQFPQCEKAIPDPAGAKHWFAIDATALATIAAYAQKHGKENLDSHCSQPIVFRFKDELSPATFTIKTKQGLEAFGVVMPVRPA